jgi:hypothetical protein
LIPRASITGHGVDAASNDENQHARHPERHPGYPPHHGEDGDAYRDGDEPKFDQEPGERRGRNALLAVPRPALVWRKLVSGHGLRP